MGQRGSTSHSKNSKATHSNTRERAEEPPPGYSELPPQNSQPLPAYSRRTNRRSRQNPPSHLALRVARYLDPVSRLCLRYTCRSLFESLPLQVESELGSRPGGSSRLVSQVRDSGPRTKKSKRAPQYDLKREGRLQLLRYFFKDGFFGDEKSICGACLKVHKDAFFLPVELEKSDAERSCRALTGKLWICPHISLTYKQVTLGDLPNTSGECFKCNSIHVTTPSQSSARICFPIARVDSSPSELTGPKVAAALALLGPAIMCPHFTLASLFDKGYRYSDDWLAPQQGCSKCPALFKIDVKRTDRNDGTHLLRLVVVKDFKKIKGVTELRWVNQLVQPERTVAKSRYDGEPFAQSEWKLGATEAAWRKAEKECEQVMHMGVEKHQWYGKCKGCLGKNNLKD